LGILPSGDQRKDGERGTESTLSSEGRGLVMGRGIRRLNCWWPGTPGTPGTTGKVSKIGALN